MEPFTAAFVVSLLAQHAASLAGRGVKALADGAEDVLADKLGAVVAAVRKHFAGDAGAQDALDRLDAAPQDPRRQAGVEERLEEAMTRDGQFAATLGPLVEAVRRAQGGSVVIRDAGAVAVGGDVTVRGGRFAAGRDLRVGESALDER